MCLIPNLKSFNQPALSPINLVKRKKFVPLDSPFVIMEHSFEQILEAALHLAGLSPIQIHETLIHKAQEIIEQNQPFLDRHGSTEGAPYLLSAQNADLPQEPLEDIEVPDPFAFRESSSAFCEEQRAWKTIIESDENETLLTDLRWSIMLKNWKNKAPIKKLEELIGVRDEQIAEIGKKIESFFGYREPSRQLWKPEGKDWRVGARHERV